MRCGLTSTVASNRAMNFSGRGTAERQASTAHNSTGIAVTTYAHETNDSGSRSRKNPYNECASCGNGSTSGPTCPRARCCGAHKQASLEELGQLHEPVLTKDAIAGRIRRLLAMADKRAEELGIPDTESSLTPEMLAEEA